jgi:hypothetical protein
MQLTPSPCRSPARRPPGLTRRAMSRRHICGRSRRRRSRHRCGLQSPVSRMRRQCVSRSSRGRRSSRVGSDKRGDGEARCELSVGVLIELAMGDRVGATVGRHPGRTASGPLRWPVPVHPVVFNGSTRHARIRGAVMVSQPRGVWGRSPLPSARHRRLFSDRPARGHDGHGRRSHPSTRGHYVAARHRSGEAALGVMTVSVKSRTLESSQSTTSAWNSSLCTYSASTVAGSSCSAKENRT